MRSLTGLLAIWMASLVCNAEPPVQTISVTGPESSIQIEFDEYAVPRIVAGSYVDGAFALGYLHANERFFQMDLLRRRAAGRLSEIVGPETVGSDRAMRVFGFSDVAREVVENLPATHHAWLEAYRDGANAGLSGMAAPLEYAMLGVEPEPWRMEDSVLVLLDMTNLLRSGSQEDLTLAGLRAALPGPMVDLLAPRTTRFDAPIDATAEDPTGGYSPVSIPSAAVFSVASLSFADDEIFVETELRVLGSNSWAVAGSRTVHGGAVVANDMHLPLVLPNIWYRAGIQWPDADGSLRTVAGVSLPGLPGVIAGSSDHLAWGFTNLTADLVDLVPLEMVAGDDSRYRFGNGTEEIAERQELIGVKGAEAEVFVVRTTRWGPITRTGFDGTPLAMKWGALDPANTNLRLLDLAMARTLEEGLSIARSWRGPAQNIVMADDRGDIAWTIAGFVPTRRGFDGGLDPGWARGDVVWTGNLEGEARPQILRPASGILFTANNRVLAEQAGRESLGRDFAIGVRAQRIRALLEDASDWDENDVFAVALDTRTALMDPYREYLLRAAGSAPFEDELTQRAIEIVRDWDGTADADQPGYRLLRTYRSRVHRAVLQPLLAPVRERFPDWSYSAFNADEPVLRLLEERPRHLLNAAFSDWDELLRNEFADMVRSMGPGDDGGIEKPWGESNRSRISHPFAEMAPATLRRSLQMAGEPQSGDTSSVRVARPTFGASERFAISPGRLDEGLIHMPGGQSGKPLSPHFRDQHAAWAAGEPLRLLSGGPWSRIVILSPEAKVEGAVESDTP